MSGEIVVFSPKIARPDFDYLRACAHLWVALKAVSLRVLYEPQRMIGAKQDIRTKESAIMLNASHGSKLTLRHYLEHQQTSSKVHGSGLDAMEVKPHLCQVLRRHALVIVHHIGASTIE